jgi:chromosome partitioning protein
MLREENRLSRVIAIANQKGGVGKTTTSVNLTASLAATKRNVLMIDLDPQGNATVGCGIHAEHFHYSTNEVLLGECEMAQAIIKTAHNFDLLPANNSLTVAEVRLLQQHSREYTLAKALEPVRSHYDFIIIDCPPTLNMLTVNALVAADSILIPMQCEYYALEGLKALLSTVERLRQSANPKLHLEGLLRTMYDGRNRLTQEISDQLNQVLGDKLFQTVIPRNVRLAEAPSHGLPVLIYDSRSQGAAAHLALAGEMLRRHEKEAGVSDRQEPVQAE